MLSVRSPSGANTAMTTPRISRSPVVHVSLRSVEADDEQHEEREQRAADQALDRLAGADPRAQRRLADRRADEQGADVVGDDAEHDQEQRVGADVVARRRAFDQRRISAANEPSSPIHTTPIVVMAMFGSGPGLDAGGADEPERRRR